MELYDALKFLTQELEKNPSYYKIIKEHITTNFISSYAGYAINLPDNEFLFCPSSNDVENIADHAADQILNTLIRYILKP